MPAERYFVDANLCPHQHEELAGSEFHHLAHVMRARKGERIELVNGRGSLAHAVVQDLAKDRARVLVESVEHETPSSCRLIAAQGLIKQNRLELLLEKGTELGVDTFWLFPADHSGKKEFYPSQVERSQAIILAAMKQCGRLYLPSIILKPPLNEWGKEEEATLFFGDLSKGTPLFMEAWGKAKPVPTPIGFVTGPEGGFSCHEVETLKERGGQGVRLHGNILRAETASLAALSLLSHWMTE